ncbi:FeoA family protein [Balneolaceae bacterium ANBcel3]|nr:FeoA family protein [Balneolaceae bacterium ANBcel3]
MTLLDLETKQSGRVVSIEGGRALSHRLDSLGIREGVSISKIGSQFFRGPVIVSVNGHHTALGWGIASRVNVSVSDTNKQTL